MIAYVFWHWPAPGADRAAYEAAQRGFQTELNRTGSDGFQRSVSYRVRGAQWLAGGDGYEDWYLLDGSHALDPLNDAAVSGRMRRPHEEAARGASGIGGLYRLMRGVPRLSSGTVNWVRKPAGEPYDAFYARFAGDAVMWRRQMTLGPTPEFLVEGSVPAGLEGLTVERDLYAP